MTCRIGHLAAKFPIRVNIFRPYHEKHTGLGNRCGCKSGLSTIVPVLICTGAGSRTVARTKAFASAP